MSLFLNRTNYPLVVGNSDKITFANWETSGSTVELTAFSDSEALCPGALTWHSLNPEIAEIISVHGLSCTVRGRTTGITEIIAKTPGQSSASCLITVIDNITRTTVGEIVLNLSELTLPLYGSAKLIPVLYPKDICRGLPDALAPERMAKTMDESLQWYSDNEAVVTVSDGIIAAHRTGDARITVISSDVGRKAFCLVHVREAIQTVGITAAAPETFFMKTGEQFRLDAQILTHDMHRILPPLMIQEPEITYISENRYIADVDENGVVTAYSNSNCQQVSEDRLRVSDMPDTVSILATAKEGGFVTRFNVCVSDGNPHSPAVYCPAKTVAASLPQLPAEISMEITQILRLSPDFGNNLLWQSSGPEIVSVNCEGYLCAYQSGQAYITVCDKERGAICQCRVTVKEASPFLHNLHIPSETITAHSLTLLWNRAALTDTGGLAFYRIMHENHPVAETTRLGFTLEGLSPDTCHSFTVCAVGKDGSLLASQSIFATTCPDSLILNVLDAPWHADGSGRHNDTLAIQKAIDACPPGGTVLLPKGGIFYCGALFLKSNMTFQVDGILFGSDNPKDYPFVLSRWEGFRKFPQKAQEWENSTGSLPCNTYVRASLLNAGEYHEGIIGTIGPFSVKNLIICGNGQINGNGFRLAFNEGANQAAHGGGLPVPFSPIKNQVFRGSLIRLHNAQNVLVADLTLAFGPGWQVHPIYCDSITFDNLEIISKGTGRTGAADDINILNGDGIDPDSCSRINIVNCRFFCGDDSVTLKSGRNKEGNLLHKPSEYIRVTDCIADGSKAGFVIGSEIASGAHDVIFQNLTISNAPLMGLWIKTMRPRGGVIERIFYRDIVIKGTELPVWVSMNYTPNAASAAAVNPADEVPVIRNITFENVDCKKENKNGIRLEGLPESPLRNIRFLSVKVDKIETSDVEGIFFRE